MDPLKVLSGVIARFMRGYRGWSQLPADLMWMWSWPGATLGPIYRSISLHSYMWREKPGRQLLSW